DINDCQKRGQPVLVGTTSIEVSEYISDLLKKENIRHQVLNAKFHQKEAEIIAQAGRSGTVTIATNMAGRGTDIVLGGNPEAEIEALENKDEASFTRIRQEWQKRHDQVVASGGLHIIGTERHESRRIDNQLRGRSGRQGDPGSSRFYLSLEDNLMRIFASDRISAIMQKIGMEENEAIESPLVSRAIENAQRKVEGHNFDIRKHLLEFDDVANDQRKVIYQQRNELLEEEDIADTVKSMRYDVVNEIIDKYIPSGSIDEMWDVQGLTETLNHEFSMPLNIAGWLADDQSLHEESLREKISHAFDVAMELKEQQVGSHLLRKLEKQVMLDFLDRYWKEHLIAMDHLRQGIHLRSYAAKNPKQEYKREAFEMFVMMLNHFKHDVIRFLSRVQVRTETDVEPPQTQQRPRQNLTYSHPAAPNALATSPAAPGPENAPFVREQRKIGRNEPCPCGSGRKYKHCHGKLN
ncbi:MAG: SEC-C metal-binding domain-containing protein, partial [Gammaproteobacteria bacterium]